MLIKKGANIDKLIFKLIGNSIFLKKIIDLGYNLNEINNYNKSVIECFCHDETEILELILKNTKDLKKEYLEKSLVTLDNIIKSLKYNSHYDENAIEKIFNKVNKNIELIK